MLKLTKKYLKGYGVITVLAPLFKFFEVVAELLIPRIVTAIIDTGIGRGDVSYVWKMGGSMLALYFFGFTCAALCQYFSAKSAFGFGTNLRQGLYAHINRLPLKDIDEFQPSTLVVRVGLDVNNTQNALNRFMRLATRAPFLLIGSLIMAVQINAKLSLIFFAAALLIALALFLVMKKSAPRLLAINKGHDEVTRQTRENLSGVRVVRAFNKQGDAENDFDAAARELKKESQRFDAISAATSPLTYLVVNIAILCILYFGAFSVNAGNLTQGETVALINYMLQLLNALVLLAMLAVLFTRAGASAKRINNILDTPAENVGGITEIEESEAANDFAGNSENLAKPLLAFKNVSAGYTGSSEYSLKNISFELRSGQTLGIVGGTGSGKTTLVGLIPRLYDYDGEIEFFGRDLRAYNPIALRGVIGFAPQTAVLFAGTVRENIAMGRDITDEEIFTALKIARADFIKSLDTEVLRGGSNFSGGQRQRLCIARALAARPRLLILDDTTSALDYGTDAAVRRELNKLKDMTKIIVTQRAASVKNADLIIVLDEGTAVGIGTHKELLSSCAVYKEIVEIQEKM